LRDRIEEAEQNYRKARVAIKEALESSSDPVACCDLLVWNTTDLTDLLATSGHPDEAQAIHDETVQIFRAYISSFGDETRERGDMLDNLAWLLTSTPLQDLRRPAEAVTLAEEAVQLAPTGYTWHTLGVARLRSGAVQEAVAALETSLQIDQRQFADVPSVYLSCSLAVANARLNHPAEALRFFERGTKLIEQQLLINTTLRDLHAEAEDAVNRMDEAAKE
jgi:tetratricopeptide (TPR) repeat protein